MSAKCDDCGAAQRTHTVYQYGREAGRCCRCHLAAGGLPADWHGDCLRADLKRKTADTPVVVGGYLCGACERSGCDGYCEGERWDTREQATGPGA